MSPAAEMGAPWPVEFMGAAEGGFGGEAVYCAVILWLSVVAWIIFTSVGDGDEAAAAARAAAAAAAAAGVRRRRRHLRQHRPQVQRRVRPLRHLRRLASRCREASTSSLLALADAAASHGDFD